MNKNIIGAAALITLAATSIPATADTELLRLGTSGNATVFAANTGVIGLIAQILLWVSSYTAYL